MMHNNEQMIKPEQQQNPLWLFRSSSTTQWNSVVNALHEVLLLVAQNAVHAKTVQTNVEKRRTSRLILTNNVFQFSYKLQQTFIACF